MLRKKHLPLTFISGSLFIFLYIVCVLVPTHLLAQDNEPTDIQITSLQVTKDEKDGQSLNIYFVATDSQGKVTNLNNLDSISANLLLDVGNPSSIQAKLQTPQDPLYVVLVITARQRFSGSAQDIKKAATEIVSNLPAKSYTKLIVVSTSDAEPPQSRSFTELTETVIGEIGNIKLTGAPCLYNSMIDAFDSLTTSDIPPNARRAIVLISDGNDQTSATSTIACSKTYGMDQVLEASAKNDIQIYTIPVQANGITLQDGFLKTLAGNSGGLYANDAKSVVDNATTVAGYLKGQILFAANPICSSANSPDNALHSATLNLKPKDGELLTDSFTFVLKSTCDTLITPTPIPLSIDGNVGRFDSLTETLPINISKIGDTPVEAYCIVVKDKDNSQVESAPIQIDAQPQFNLTAKQFIDSHFYYGKLLITVIACDKDGKFILDQDQKPITFSVETEVIPPTPTPIPPTATPIVPTALPTLQSPVNQMIKEIQSGNPLVLLCLVGIVAFAVISGVFVLRVALRPHQDSTVLPPILGKPSAAITVLPELMPPSQPTRMYDVISNVLPSNVNAEIKQPDKSMRWQVTHTPYKLGNNKRGIIGNDIDFIDDQTVSDEQAEFHYRDEYFYVKNLGQNAILVNGEKVPKGLEVALKPNANTLQIGQKTMLEFYYEIEDENTQVWLSNAP